MGATKFLFKAERELFMDELGIYGFYMLMLLEFLWFFNMDLFMLSLFTIFIFKKQVKKRSESL